MKNLLARLAKFNTPLCYALISLVFGAAFIILPAVAPLALDILLALAGVVTVVIGIVTVRELDTPDRSASYYINALRTLALIAFGIFVIVARSSLSSHLCSVFGIYALVRAVPTLVRSVLSPLVSNISWWIRLVLSTVEAVLGAWLIFYPRWPHLLSGIMLLLVGIELLIKHKRSRSRHSEKSDTLYDLDFEDKS